MMNRSKQKQIPHFSPPPYRHLLSQRNTPNKQKAFYTSILGLNSSRTGTGYKSLIIMAITLSCIVVLTLYQGSVLISKFYKRKQNYVQEDFGRSRKEAYGTLQKLMRQNNEKASNLCYILPNQKKLRSQWNSHINTILNATKFPDDVHYLHRDWTLQLLSQFTSVEINEWIVSYPYDMDIMKRLLDIISQKIINHLDTTSSTKEGITSTKPIKIAVMGGSIAEGRQCIESLNIHHNNKKLLPIPHGSVMANPSFCAWPYRLESFINSLMGFELIKIVNLAEEGTDVAFGTSLFRNRMLPPYLLSEKEEGGLDVVIVAYKTSEVTFGGGGDITEEVKGKLMKEFVDAVEGSSCHDPPLIVHLDDMTIDQIGHGKDFDGRLLRVRYTDAMERALKATGEASSSMAGHVVMAWILARAFTNTALHYCSSSTKNDQHTIDTKHTNDACHSKNSNPCIFAWYASPKGGTLTKPSQINAYISPYLIENTGWNAASDMTSGYTRKTGLVTSTLHARLSIEFKNIQSEIRHLNLLTLKSNHEKWRDGVVKFTLLVNPNQDGVQARATTFEISGGYDSGDVTYHFEVDLEEENKVGIGSDVMLQMELVDGDGFKILGIMLCS